MLGQTPNYYGNNIPMMAGNNIPMMATPFQQQDIPITYQELLRKISFEESLLTKLLIDDGFGKKITLVMGSRTPGDSFSYSIDKAGEQVLDPKDSEFSVSFSNFEIGFSEVIKIDFEINDENKVKVITLRNEAITRKIIEMYAAAYKSMIKKQEETPQQSQA